MNKFKVFKKNYNKAIKDIKSFLDSTDDNPPMNELVRWMLETEANPYGYLPSNWAGVVSSAEGFASLLHNIHHALYDDGDITFVSVDDEPRIVFCNQHEPQFKDNVLHDQEKYLSQRFQHEYDIRVLSILPNDFGKLYDEYSTKHAASMNDAVIKLRHTFHQP